MTTGTTQQQRLWYPLDGAWHKSVHQRMSALHLPGEGAQRGMAACCVGKKRTLWLYEDDEYPESQIGDRTLCERCLKLAKAKP